MHSLASLVDLLLKLFALGLFVRAVLSWITLSQARKAEQYLDHLYGPFLKPLRRAIKPLHLNTTPPSAIDFSPLVLLLVVWWLIHPFLMWLLR